MDQDNLYKSYDRNLYKIGVVDDPTNQMLSNLNSNQGADNSAQLEVAADTFGSGVDVSTSDQGVGYLAGGKTQFDNTQIGYILGIDKGVAKFYLGNSTNYINFDGTTASIAGSFSATSLNIPDTTTAASFHVDSSGNTWWGANVASGLASANASVTSAGVAVFKSITLSGSVSISGIANNSSTDISLMNFSHNLVFTSASLTQINWSSGTIVMSNGRTFTISAGNTGAMAAVTFIYLDTAVSSTVLQTTTTYSTATGANKIIIATAQNNATAASVIPFGGGQPILDGVANIFANSITAASISTLTMTGKSCTFDTGTIGGFTMAATTLSATNFLVTSGAANVANITVGTGANAGGINSANASGDIVFWAGSTFANRATAPFRVTAAGAVVATSATISGYVVSSKGAFGGDGSDGALTISSGTTTIDLAGAATFIKNYTSISITGTGKLAFINPHANGTTIFLRSQGNVTLTSSTAPMIDCSGLGASAGTGVSIGASSTGNGTDGTDAYGFGAFKNNKGTGGQGPAGGGVDGAAPTFAITTSVKVQASGKYPYGVPGAGAGAGGAQTAGGASATSGNGSRGGGCLIIECAGAWNFTTAAGISVAGIAGIAGTGSGGNLSSAGGGGGGGGVCFAFYNTLTANSGTITVTGGTVGSTTQIGATTTASVGGGGASLLGAATSGTGAAGFSLVAQNTEFG